MSRPLSLRLLTDKGHTICKQSEAYFLCPIFHHFKTSSLSNQKVRAMALSSAKGKLIAVIGDEDTCVGFLLGGIGEVNRAKTPSLNFMVVDKNTPNTEIEETFRGFLKRGDIDIILINQNVAEGIRHLIDAHQEPVPSVLEIPSKDHPYDPSKDSILRRAKGMFSGEDFR